MSDLYPTPTRLALLADIRDGKVVEDWHNDVPGEAWRGAWPARTKVTARVDEMMRAGWVETDPADDDLHVRGIRLKAPGEAVLAEHPAKEPT